MTEYDSYKSAAVFAEKLKAENDAKAADDYLTKLINKNFVYIADTLTVHGVSTEIQRIAEHYYKTAFREGYEQGRADADAELSHTATTTWAADTQAFYP